MSSVLKWTTGSSSKLSQSDTNVLQFENGYLVETVVEGNDIGVVPYKIRVSDDGELYAVDELNSNIMKITPPLSQCKTSFSTSSLLYDLVFAVLSTSNHIHMPSQIILDTLTILL
jgi:hypothetical protein